MKPLYENYLNNQEALHRAEVIQTAEKLLGKSQKLKGVSSFKN